MKLLAFDIDGTLSEHGHPIPESVSSRLKSFEQRGGIRLAFLSGKPAFYLAGLVRGMGLDHPILAGENGSVIFDAKTLKETRLAKRPEAFQQIEQQVISRFQDQVWIQPNRVAFTAFPRDLENVPVVAAFLRERISPFADKVKMYQHVDAVDILPIGVDKGAAMRVIKKELHLQTQDVISIGDSTNDLPMFAEAGRVIIIGTKIDFPGAARFTGIEEALDRVEESFLR